MAYGKKYFSSIKSNNNLDYYLEIWVADHTGASTELTLGAGGPVIEYDTDEENRFSPIISSSCKIPYLVENSIDSQFIDFLRNTYQEKQVYIHIYRASSSAYSGVAPLWSGFLIMDLSSGQDKSFPYVENLKFVDGLALLKDVDFVDLNVPGGSNPPFEERVQGNYAEQNMYFGPATYIFWIREILAKAGAAIQDVGATQNYTFTTSVNWYNGDMDAINQSADPLEKTKCAVSMFHTRDNEGVFFPDNCYNVLKELLRHWGARITYWKHSFWIVQIPEYITAESGTISSPVNNNSRIYSLTGAFQASQNHLGSTYNTRYFQEISNDKISKLTGTKYDYLPIVKQVNGDFLSFSSQNYYGGFPFGQDAPTQEVYQGTIFNPSAADSLWLSIPLDWHWDLTNAPAFPSGHTKGWWCSIKFNFYGSDGTTTYYLQYSGGANGTYYWEDSASWVPLGNKSPKYICSSRNETETAYVGFEQSIPFVDGSGNPITMNDSWSFYLDIEDYGTGASNPGSFYINFSKYSAGPQRMRNPNNPIQVPSGSGNSSGTVFWTNTLEPSNNVGIIVQNQTVNPAGFNAGTQQDDISFLTNTPFVGLLQLLKNNQQVQVGQSLNTINSAANAKQNTSVFNFNQLLWGDSIEYARSSLQVDAGASAYVNTNPNGLWGRGTLNGTKTFTQLLLDEFLYGQTKIVTTPNMRLAVGVQNKNQTQGSDTRPRYVNPIGKLRELRSAADLEYFFRRGSFYILSDEWDYEGYQILRNVVDTSTQNNNSNNLNALTTATASAAKMVSSLTQQLASNSPIAYMRQTVGATGADVVVNGNFNTDSNWTLGDGWSIDATAKKAKFAATGSTSDLVQSVLTQELTYQINFSIEVTAGTLLVKAGSSGQSESITSSGNYSVYLNCQGSNDIKFTAGTTFTGTITYISARDQKSLTSVPIEAIGSTVFKTGDIFNLVSENNDVPLELTVTADQSANDTTISVASTPLYEDITASSYLLINQDDLSAQYQNKTKGTVAGFGIDADGISKGGIEITGWLNSDTMSGAAVTNVPTALSVKNYVDGQVGASDTLQEVTDNGNTTTNSIMIGSSSSPSRKLEATSTSSYVAVLNSSQNNSFLSFNDANTSGDTYVAIGSENGDLISRAGNTERMRLTTGGNVLIGTTSDTGQKLQVSGSIKTTTAGTGLQFYGTGGSGNIDAFGSNSLILMTNSVERAKITSGGNVLIGTTTDNGDKLQIGVANSPPAFVTDPNVAATIASTTNGDEVALQLYVNDGTNNIRSKYFVDDTELLAGFDVTYSSGLNGFAFKMIGSEKMRLSTNGNLGIGTTSPSQKLTVEGNIELGTGGYIYGDTTTPYLRLSSAAGSIMGYGVGYISVGPSFVYNNHNGEQFRIASATGFVGLGTTSPTEKLHVVGDALITGDSMADAFKPAATGEPIKFKNFGSTELARITDGGNVGIGTTSPSSFNAGANKLVVGNGTNFQGLTVNSIVEGNIYFADGTTSSQTYEGVIGYNHSNNFMHFYTNHTERARITSGGNLLIGTTSDVGYKLDVNGSLRVSSVSVFTSQITAGYGVNFTNGNTDFLLYNNSGEDVLYMRDVTNGAMITTWGVNDFTVNKNLIISGSLTGTTATFSGQVTIPATPVASTDAASKSYVDAQVSATDSLQEVTTVGNTTTNSVRIGSSTSPNRTLSVYASSSSIVGDIRSASGNNSFLSFSNNASTADQVRIGSSSGNAVIATNYTERVRITSGGNVLIGTTTDSGNKLEVAGRARVQSVFELDDVLTLNQISTPADPADGKSSIYMDSADGSIKVKINVGGTVVTRTIASFE